MSSTKVTIIWQGIKQWFTVLKAQDHVSVPLMVGHLLTWWGLAPTGPTRRYATARGYWKLMHLLCENVSMRPFSLSHQPLAQLASSALRFLGYILLVC